MTTTVPSAAPATIQPAFTDPERLALAGFLAPHRLTQPPPGGCDRQADRPAATR